MGLLIDLKNNSDFKTLFNTKRIKEFVTLIADP